MPLQGVFAATEEGAGEVQEPAVPVAERLPAEVSRALPEAAGAAEAGPAGQPAERRLPGVSRRQRQAAAAVAGRQPDLQGRGAQGAGQARRPARDRPAGLPAHQPARIPRRDLQAPAAARDPGQHGPGQQHHRERRGKPLSQGSSDGDEDIDEDDDEDDDEEEDYEDDDEDDEDEEEEEEQPSKIIIKSTKRNEIDTNFMFQLYNYKMQARKSKQAKIVVNLGNCQYEVLRQVAGALNFRVQSDREVGDCDLIWTDWAVTLDQVAKLRPH